MVLFGNAKDRNNSSRNDRAKASLSLAVGDSTSQELRDRAKHCRWLSKHMTDSQTLTTLTAMAVELDEQAAALEMPPPTNRT